VALQNAQVVVDEIELDLERVRVVRNRQGGEPARGHVEGDVPGVVRPRRQREPDFAHNLSPHVQRRTSVFPIRVIQFRPNHNSLPSSSCSYSSSCSSLSLQRLRGSGRLLSLTINIIRKRSPHPTKHPAGLILCVLKISSHPLSHSIKRAMLLVFPLPLSFV